MYKVLSQSKTKSPVLCSSETNSTDIPLEFQEEAIFAGGSFWDLEAAFGRVDGVFKTATGYCGGTLKKPAYREVIDRRTGHTEAIRVLYDKRKISYILLCKVFWQSHDPTNREFLEFGIDTHYGSVIFYANEDQRRQAQESKIKWQMRINKRIVTKSLPSPLDFYLAENQHQKYFLQRNYMRLCESLSLRSTEQFVDSHLACKLNGILGQQENNSINVDLKRFIESYELSKETKLVLDQILLDLEKNRAGHVSA